MTHACDTCHQLYDQVDHLRAQLVEAQRERDDHKHCLELIDFRTQLQSQAAQFAGMRDFIYTVQWGQKDLELAILAKKVLSTPASEWEKRVQELVKAFEWIAADWDRMTLQHCKQKATEALSIWNGTDSEEG